MLREKGERDLETPLLLPGRLLARMAGPGLP